MSSAGFQLVAGRIPGERIATSVITNDSSTFTTTETEVASVEAPLVNGRTYKVTADLGFQISADGVLRVQIRLDTAAGTVRQIRDVVIDNTGTVQSLIASFEHTATATGDQTFVVTGDVLVGGGTANLNASGSIPSYVFVDYVSG